MWLLMLGLIVIILFSLFLSIQFKDFFYLIFPLIILIVFTFSKLKFKNKIKVKLVSSQQFYKITKKSISSLILVIVNFLKKIGIYVIIILLFFILAYFNRNSLSKLFNIKSPSTPNILCIGEEQEILLARKCSVPIVRSDDGHGSGFVVTRGFLVTNKHVIEDSDRFTILIGGVEREATLWNYSHTYDLAILKVPKSIEACNWFDSSKIETTENLYAIGWPLSPEGESTLSRGVFSRMVNFDGIEYVQTDTSINPGNSGGPLINKCGVVGINTSKVAQEGVQGLGFALTSNGAKLVIEQLIKEGSDNTFTPHSEEFEQKQQNSNSRGYVAPPRSIDINSVTSYRDNINGVKASWESARGRYPQDLMNKLIDSFTRQIVFCNTLVERLQNNGGRASQDDLFMWDSIIKMSNETAAITQALNKGNY